MLISFYSFLDYLFISYLRSSIQKMQTKSIYLPLLKIEEAVCSYAQMRPFREGGNLLSKSQVQGKTIIHNYGHGGAGVSLAPGSALHVVRLLKQLNIKEKSKIAVLGSGIVGLYSALQIIKAYPKTQLIIYSERIPVFGVKDNTKLITSQIAPGFWMPYNYGIVSIQERQELSSLSYNQYKHLSKQEGYRQCITQVGMYDISDEPFKYHYRDNLTKSLKSSYKQCKIRINNKVEVDGRYFQTYRIDLQLMLKILIADLKERGVKFQQRKVEKNDLRALNEDIFVNCTGMGSRQLVNDSKLKGLKGHLVQFKNPNPQKYNVFFKANVGNHVVNVYMHDSRIILGLTKQEIQNSDVDPAKIKLLQDNYQQILKSFNLIDLKPKL